MSRVHDRSDMHWDARHNWALVLAAGEGSRLHALTTTAAGISIPKQFCSLGGGASLLHDAIRRAHAVAPRERTCAVLAEQHRHWWQALRLDIAPQNMIRQPRNRGTANGILLPLLRIMHRDPDARLLVLPSDHYVTDEDVLASSLRQAMSAIESDRGHVVLLGITPEEPDAELGYIVADAAPGAIIRGVSAFVEKPTSSEARELLAAGGVWNSFIFTAHTRTLLRVFQERCPDLVDEMSATIRLLGDSRTHEARLVQLYERLPQLDFSRDILQRSPEALKVLTVPACGWSDLGTPRRVREAVNRYGSPGATCDMSEQGVTGIPAFLDLAAHCASVGSLL